MAKGKRKVAREKIEHVTLAVKQHTLQRGVEKAATKTCTPLMKMRVRNNETPDNDELLRAWCLLEESVNELWQEVISRRDKQKVKKATQVSLLCVQNSQNSNSKRIIDVKDRWVKVRVTMGSGAAGHVMPEAMFPRVQLERKTSPKRFVAADGEQTRDLGEKTIPFKTNEGLQRCITVRSASVVKPLISVQKVVRAGNIVVLDEKNPHIRNTRRGTMIKLHVNSGVCNMDMWICFGETGPVFSWQGQTASDKPVRLAALCASEQSGNMNTGRI